MRCFNLSIYNFIDMLSLQSEIARIFASRKCEFDDEN